MQVPSPVPSLRAAAHVHPAGARKVQPLFGMPLQHDACSLICLWGAFLFPSLTISESRRIIGGRRGASGRTLEQHDQYTEQDEQPSKYQNTC